MGARARRPRDVLSRRRRPAVFQALPPPMLALHQRLKNVFDPHGILNRGRMYPEL